MAEFGKWKANYIMGNSLIGRPDPGSGDYDKIDRKLLESFEIIDETGNSIYKTKVESNEKLVCRLRSWQDFSTGEILGRVWVVGVRKLIRKFIFWTKIISTITVIFPDKHVEYVNDWVNVGGEPEYRRDEEW